MKNSSKNSMKTILCILAVICVVLAAVFAITRVSAYNKAHPDLPQTGNYDDFGGGEDVSGGDIQFDDDGTMEMDSIPSNGDAPVVPADAE